MREIIIPLTKGHSTVIDAIDRRFAQLKWHAKTTPTGGVYACRGLKIEGDKRPRNFLLHRMVLKAPPSLQIDHINRDTLDNRRCNLRIATKSQNQANRAPTKGPYKGVNWVEWRQRYQVGMAGRIIGYFRNPIEAARAYDAAAYAAFGEFAWLNRDHFAEV